MMDQYTRLLETAALANDERVADQAVHKLIAHLKSTGRMKMLPSVMGELKRLALRRKLLSPKLEVASEKERSAALKEAKEAGIEVRDAVVNPSLVSGWRGFSGGRLVDKTGKRALIDIYQKATH